MDGLFKRLLFLSFFAVALTIGLGIAMTVILLISDHEAVDTWCTGYYWFRGERCMFRITVSVWLSMLSLFANKLVGVLFAEAIAISWWTSAMEGRTIRQLHLDWESGRSFFSAVLSICRRRPFVSRIVVASISIFLFSFHGIVFQRASRAAVLTATVSAELGQQLPPGWSGQTTLTSDEPGQISGELASIMKDYADGKPVRLDVEGCGNQSASAATICTADLNAIGWNYECEEDTVQFIYPPPQSELNQTFGDQLRAGQEATWSGQVFNVQFEYGGVYSEEGGNPDWNITLTVVHKISSNCSAPMTRRTCTMTPAVVTYPVSIAAGIATLREPKSHVMWNSTSAVKSGGPKTDSVVTVLHNPRGDNVREQYNFTVFGIEIALEKYIGSTGTVNSPLSFGADNATIEVPQELIDGPGPETSGGLATAFVIQRTDGTDGPRCQASYHDPFQRVLDSIRDIAFRTAVAIAQRDIRAVTPDVSPSTKYYERVADPRGHAPVARYVTNKGWVLAGGLLMLISLVGVLQALWDFWSLGRKVTMSPLEIGKALHGPGAAAPGPGVSVLDAAAGRDTEGTNAPTNDLVSLLGDVKVKYGEVAPQKLGFAMEEEASEPVHGRVYY